MNRLKQKKFVLGLIVFICLALIVLRSKPKKVHDWTEGKALAGTISMILDEYADAKGEEGVYPPSWEDLASVESHFNNADDFFRRDMTFQCEDVSWTASYDENLNPPIKYIITVSAPQGYESRYKKITYDQDGNFKEYR